MKLKVYHIKCQNRRPPDLWHKTGHGVHIMLRDLLTQKCSHKKSLLILDTPKHVDSENIKLKIGHCPLLFSKQDFCFIKIG
jgi:hypothetical protein